MHVVFSLETGGLENGVVNLCNHLDPQHFEASVCVFRGGGVLEMRLDQERVGVTTTKRWGNHDPSLPCRLAWLLRKRQIDILHTHSWGTLVEGVIAAKLARTRVSIHGEHGVMEERPRNLPIQRFLWSRTSQVTAVASPLADHMAKIVRFPRDKIQVIPNGVDSDRFQPRHESTKQLRKEFGLPTTGLLIGMAARLVPLKNHTGVLNALAKLRDDGLEIILAFAGDGPLHDDLCKLANKLSLERQVHFLGNVEGIERFLNAIDLFVLNSTSEGMSNTILEAMSCGLPVVATDVGANPDLILHGHTGHLVPSNDPLALAESLKALANNPAKRSSMGSAARERIEQIYSIEKMVQGYSNLYQSLASKHIRGTHHSHNNVSPVRG